MSQIMGLPADKLLEDYTPGEKMAYTYNSGYHAAVADVLEIVDRETCCGRLNARVVRAAVEALLEDKS